MEPKDSKTWLQIVPIRILLPVVLTIAFFTGTIFLLILPIMESRMMEDRRMMISELTEAAWSVLDAYHKKEVAGAVSRSEAQRIAADTLRRLRYGPESKDYFWINDMHPYLIMHPYRPDLEGEDISNFTDPQGKRLFVEFVNTVRQSGAGYVDYQWQWKDDPNRIVSKISFVKGFEPWRWIIGTGIYVEDVRAEIAAITRTLTLVCLVILLIIVGLSWYVIGQSMRSERHRREANLALLASEEKYRLLAETALEFIFALDDARMITYVNLAWVEASGYRVSEMIGKKFDAFLPDTARAEFEKRLDQLHEPGTQTSLFETQLRIKDGTIIPVEAALAPLLDDDQTTQTIITARDITEKKRAEKQARLHQEQLFQADKMATLGTLASGMAHEINNPITAVMLNAPTLQQIWQSVLPILDEYQENQKDFKVGQMDYAMLRDRIPSLLNDINDGANRVKNIVDDLKDFARQGPPEMGDVIQINDAAAKSISLVGNLIKKSTQHFKSDFGDDIPTFVGNAQKIEQVLINLLVNACQALTNSQAGVSLATRYDAVNDRIIVEISDEGSGMSSKVLQRIRDPFFTTKRESGGTGLGLAIVDRIVEDHHGHITFTSVVGKGTTVRVHFPAGDHSSAEDKV